MKQLLLISFLAWTSIAFSQHVGIGVTDPEAKLHLAGGNWDAANTEGDFKIGTSTHRLVIGAAVDGGGAGDMRMFAKGGISRLILGAGSTDVLTVRSSGRVGIGTLSPGTRLHVSGGDQWIDRGATTQGLTRSLTIGGARFGAGNPFAQIDFQNLDSDGANVDYTGARISSENNGATDDGDLRFYTASGGTLTQKMTITENGDVGIGTLSPAEKLTVKGSALQVPADLKVIGSISTGGNPFSMYVSGRYAYVVDIDSDDFKVIDVTDPANPGIISSIALSHTPVSVFVSGRFAYVSDLGSQELTVIDISNPSAPMITGSVEIGPGIRWVFVSGRHAYVVDRDSAKLKVINVSNPMAPQVIGSVVTGTEPFRVYISGDHAYVMHTSELTVIDVSDPANPAVVGTLAISATDIHVSGRYVYIIDNVTDVLRIIDISNPAAPSQVSSLPVGSFSTKLFVSGNYVYVLDNDDDDLTVIDVSNPITPILIDSLVVTTDGIPRDIFVAGRYVYVTIASSPSSLKIIDASGGEMVSLMAHSLEAGNLQVRNDILAQGQLQVTGGINVGAGGLYSSGDVGITGKVHISGGDIFADRGGATQGLSRSLTIGGARNAAGNPFAQIDFQNMDSNNANTDYTGARISSENSGASDDGDLKFYTSSNSTLNQRMIIDHNGNIGIGTTSPSRKLHVSKGSSGAVAHSGSVAVFEDDASAYVSIVTGSSNERGILFGEPSNNAAGAIIYNNPSNPDGIQFRTNGNLTRMTIDDNGNVGIGDATPDAKLDVVGDIMASGNVIAACGVLMCSDARYKIIQKQADNVLARINALDGVYYTWKTDDFPEKQFPDGPQLGVIAQDVQEVFPELVMEGKDGYLSVDYARLSVVLLEGMKEQQAEIQALKREKVRLSQIEDRLTALEVSIDSQ